MTSWTNRTQDSFFTNAPAAGAGRVRDVHQKAVPGMKPFTKISRKNTLPARILMGLVCLICLCPSGVGAQDMRQSFAVQAEKRAQMEEKARQELARAKVEAQERAQRIKQDKDVLTAAIQELKNRNSTLETSNQEQAVLIQEQLVTRAALNEELIQSRAENRELSGFVRSAAKDLDGLLLQSLQSALSDNRHGFLDPVIHEDRFPSMTDIRAMADAWFEEIAASGQVRTVTGTIIDRQGLEQEARILVLGNFTGIYVLEPAGAPEPEVGFLLYSDASQRFFALSRLPDAATVDRIEGYLAGDRPDVPVDISRGTALRQYTLELDLAEQIPKGGPIVWPILAILGLALLILLERLVFFSRKQMKPEPFMDQLRGLVAGGDWKGCEALCRSRKTNGSPASCSRPWHSGTTPDRIWKMPFRKRFWENSGHRAVRIHPGDAGCHRSFAGAAGHGHRDDQHLSRDHLLRGRGSQDDVRRHFRGPGHHHVGAERGHPDHAFSHPAVPAGGNPDQPDGGKSRGIREHGVQGQKRVLQALTHDRP